MINIHVVLNLLQALDKSQLGDIVRQKEHKLDTPGRLSATTCALKNRAFFHDRQPKSLNSEG